MKHKSEKLFECMTDIDDRYIEEADPKHSQDMITEAKRKTKRLLYPALIASALLLCGFGYKVYSIIGAGYTKSIDRNRLEIPFDTKSSSKDVNSGETEKTNTSGVDISNIDDVFAEKFKRIDLSSGEIESLYFSPEYMLIFSDNGEAWNGAEEKTLQLDFQLDDDQSLHLACGYIDNGKYHEMKLNKGNKFSLSVKMKKGHEYYLCVTNYSSENVVIKKGSITYR